MTDDIINKICRKCKENLPASEFYKRKESRDGLRSECKACKKADSKKWREDNPEKLVASIKKYREANREKVAASEKKWKKANPEKVAASKKKWKKANPEFSQADNHRRRARKKENGGTMTAAQVREIQASAQDCFWCGTDCAQDFHLDHIVPLSKGGRNSRCNLAVSCPTCNLQKGAKDLSAWLREIGWRR